MSNKPTRRPNSAVEEAGGWILFLCCFVAIVYLAAHILAMIAK